MALVVADRVKETTTSTGTGTIDLAGAVSGFQTFVAGVGDTNTTYYAIIDPAGGTWEVGIGTVTDSTPDTLSRDTILASSNSGSAVSFGVGNKNVFSTQPADKAVYLDASGQLIIGGVAVTATAAELNYTDGVTSNIQTQLDSKLNLSGGTLTGALTLSGAPTADLHATTKIYVDELIAAGIHYHDPVRVESPDSAGSLNATYDNGTSGVGATLTNNGTQAALVIDGVTLATNDRVLIYNQTNAFENGIYTVTNTGSASTNWVLTRATDADSYGIDNQSLSEGTSIFVLEGDDGAGEVYACTTTGTITFGTTAINFSQIGKSAVITGGTGITVSSNEVSANVSATTQTTSANSVTTTASRTYAVQPDSSDNLVVNVPWTDTTTNQTITLSGDATGSGTTSISVSLSTDSVGSNEIAANAVGASELNVTGDGTTAQFLRSDGDGTFTWATPTDTNTTYSAGSGLSLTGTTFANTAPDQTVTLTGSGATTVSGTYPNFTISSTDTDTNTTYSTATSSTLGLVKIGYTENGKNYPVELSSGQMYVNVPWVDTNTTYSVGDGGLTQVNFTTARRDKLDGIESGATADQTASEILTAIKTVDGSGSGLDADTVDGIQATGFLYRDVTDSLRNINLNTSSTATDGGIWLANSNDTHLLQLYASSSGAYYGFLDAKWASWDLRKTNGGDLEVDHGGTLYKVWDAYNDGSGSGLDADLLDGNHSSAFQPAANELTWVDQATGSYGTIKVDDDRGVTWAGYAIRDNWVLMADGASTCGIYNDTDNEWAILARRNAEVELNYNDVVQAETASGYFLANNQMRSPIFYDSNNTSYYGDFASTSYIAYLGRRAHHTGHFVGSYNSIGDNSTKTNPIYTIGSSYNPADAALSNMYGIGYTNGTSASFISMSGATSWGMYVAADGDARVFLDGSNGVVTSTGSTRSPIFYDSANTGYYCDPAGSSVFNTAVTATEFYARNWFRNNESGEGLYNQATGQHWYSDDDDYWNIAGGTGANGIRFRDEHAGTIRGYVYANNANEIGFLDSDGNWAIRHVRDSRTEFLINNTEYAEINSDYLTHTSDIRTPIFYDSNNTGYYTDPASTSVMNNIYLEGAIYHNGDTNTYMQFHAADQWRVVTGGSERLEVNNSQIISTEPIYAPSFHGDGSNLTNLPGGGKVLQVVENSSNYPYSTTSTSLTNTLLGVTITPSSTSSKILIMVMASTGTSSTNNHTGMGILRGTTLIGGTANVGSRVGVVTGGPIAQSVYALAPTFMTVLDSPSTTSATQYFIAFMARSGYTTYLNRTGQDTNAQYTVRGVTRIIAMEVAS